MDVHLTGDARGAFLEADESKVASVRAWSLARFEAVTVTADGESDRFGIVGRRDDLHLIRSTEADKVASEFTARIEHRRANALEEEFGVSRTL